MERVSLPLMTRKTKRLSVSQEPFQLRVLLRLRGGPVATMVLCLAVLFLVIGHSVALLTLVSESRASLMSTPSVMALAFLVALFAWDCLIVPQLVFGLFGSQEISVSSECLEMTTIVLGARFKRSFRKSRIHGMRIEERLYATKRGSGLSRAIAFEHDGKVIRTLGSLTVDEAENVLQLLRQHCPSMDEHPEQRTL
jgi:hypothetical protein